MRTVLEADIVHRGRVTARHGVAAMFADLIPRISFVDGVVQVRLPGGLRFRRSTAGEGLTLAPSLFSRHAWPARAGRRRRYGVRMDADAWDERYAASELVWSAAPNRFVAAELGDLAPGRAVDLAAGEGRNAIWLAGLGWDVTAVDFSQVGLDKARRLAGDTPVDWVCADATTWTAESPYDLALMAYLQLPADARRAAVRRAFAALRPGGTLLVVAHDSTNLLEGTGGPQDPSVLLTAEDVLADLGGEELDVLRAERVAREVTGADGVVRTALDALVRVVRRR